jgi:hypothetical protein
MYNTTRPSSSHASINTVILSITPERVAGVALRIRSPRVYAHLPRLHPRSPRRRSPPALRPRPRPPSLRYRRNAACVSSSARSSPRCIAVQIYCRRNNVSAPEGDPPPRVSPGQSDRSCPSARRRSKYPLPVLPTCASHATRPCLTCGFVISFVMNFFARTLTEANKTSAILSARGNTRDHYVALTNRTIENTRLTNYYYSQLFRSIRN